MKPTRKTQPYRKGARQPGAALDAMRRGATAGGLNPMDVQRLAHLIAAGRRRKAGRPERPDRGPRPPRAPR